MNYIYKTTLISFFFSPILLLSNSSFSQPVSPLLFGQNAWMTDTVGNVSNCLFPPCVLFGKLHSKWKDVKNSGAKIMRYGGINADRNIPTNYQYIRMIDSIRANGMEPILQIPFYKNKYTFSDAAAIVKYINITKGRKVKYWSIGNEPDKYPLSTGEIASYVKSYSSAMKKMDPTIKIMAPELASYRYSYFIDLLKPGGPMDITGKDASGRYYVDIISFHAYPFFGDQTHDQVIAAITSPYGLRDNMTDLNFKLKNCNAFHGRIGLEAVGIAITEANINYKNNVKDNVYGAGANSFINGQFWVELLGEAMAKKVAFLNFFSVIEGKNEVSEIGYINQTTQVKKPSYYHYKMVAENFKGVYCKGVDNHSKVKAYGCKDQNQIAVVVMNQKTSVDYPYTVRLNSTYFTTGNPLKINIDAGVAKEYTDVIGRESSVVLIFNATGNILRKYEYKLRGHANKDLPPDCKPLFVDIEANGSTSFCSGASVVLSTPVCDQYTYQWVKDGQDIAGAKSSLLKVTVPGNYSVRIGCGPYSISSSSLKVSYSDKITAPITPTGPSKSLKGWQVLLKANRGNDFIYQWKKNGTPIPGATDSIYMVTSTGDYQIKIKQGTCVAWSAPLYVTINEFGAYYKISQRMGAVEELESDSIPEYIRPDFKIYPNPNTGTFNFEFNSEKEDVLYISITNLMGEIVYTETIVMKAGQYLKSVDVKNMPAGLFIFQIETSSGISSQKIVIQ